MMKNRYISKVFIYFLFLLLILIHIVYAQPTHMIFDHLTTNDGLSSNRIQCIYRDSKDYLWISTGRGLNRYDSYQIKTYNFDRKKAGTISSDRTTFILEDHNKNLWIGTDEGLNLYNPQTETFKVFKNDSTDIHSINSNFITNIFEDKKGNLWITTANDCLHKWIPGKQNFVRYPIKDRDGIIRSHPTMKSIAEDSKGNLWVVSYELRSCQTNCFCYNQSLF